MKAIRILMNSDGDQTKSNDGSFHAGCLKKHPLTLGAESCSIPVPYLFHTCWWRFVGTAWSAKCARAHKSIPTGMEHLWNKYGTKPPIKFIVFNLKSIPTICNLRRRKIMSTLETRSPLSALQVTCMGISSCLCGVQFVNMDFNSCWPYPCAGGHLVVPIIGTGSITALY